jgi:hypothetical protein
VASLLCAHVIALLVVVVVFNGPAVTVNVLPVRNVRVVPYVIYSQSYRVVHHHISYPSRLYLLAPQLVTASCLLDLVLVFLQSVLVFFVFVIAIIHYNCVAYYKPYYHCISISTVLYHIVLYHIIISVMNKLSLFQHDSVLALRSLCLC